MMDDHPRSCRSAGRCTEPPLAEARLEQVAPRQGQKREWSGVWCAEHLVRVLPMILEESNKGDKIVVRKV